jgi:hypothetical protein
MAFCAYKNIASVQQGYPDSGIGGTAISVFLVREKAKPAASEATQPSLAETMSWPTNQSSILALNSLVGSCITNIQMCCRLK